MSAKKTKNPDTQSPKNIAIEEGSIDIYGAREHNLKDVTLSFPRNQLVCFTGISGSGKSSLAFDTLYAEGQRRYMETFSAYARQFMGGLERPDVDKIDGLSPVISIEQKTVNKNPRSTVGTITEIYDFLRLLYARASEAISYNTGKKMVRFTDAQILDSITEQWQGKSVLLLASLVKSRKGHYRELFEQLQKQGYTKVRVDNELMDITPKMQLSRYKIHDIELVVDRLKIGSASDSRLKESVQLTLKKGKGTMIVLDSATDEKAFFSKNLMCLDSGISYDEPQPNSFSFNSPYGWCEKCKGMGFAYIFNYDDIFPDKALSIKNGAIAPLGTDIDAWTASILKALAKKHKFKLTDSLSLIPDQAIQEILYGCEEKIKVEYNYVDYNINWSGLIARFEEEILNKKESTLKEKIEQYGSLDNCPECNGARLKKESLYFKIDGLDISQVSNMQLDDFYDWVVSLPPKMEKRQLAIGGEIIKEISTRTKFLLQVGLKYLMLNRASFSLSGGEAQRIRLASQIGTQLMNVTYILDEPSIGLHQRDNQQLITALKELRDVGNTVIVVEHDRDMIEESDFVVDIGPGAGIHGGKVIETCTPDEFIKSKTSITASYLNGLRSIDIPKERKKGNGNFLELTGASGHNLKEVKLSIPLGTLTCITGVSGSGKSSLISDTLYPILRHHYYRSFQKPLPYKQIKGLEHIDKVIEIDQSPIGRTPRSNPATYTGVFTHIRSLFTMLPEAKIRGYAPGRFSFNVKGGRCEDCGGAGLKVIEMNFLPDVHIKCPTCQGRRYNRETLEVRYKGKSINDVLDMTVEHAVEFFEKIPNIANKIKTINEVGLGYITIGQSSTTLSGGEAQRVKLATELSKRDTGKTLYILDEPTTGLHFEDIRILMSVLSKLVDKGNTVIIIEHNLDVIKIADWVIDMGPEGGIHGGEIIAKGTPEQIAKSTKSITGKYLSKELKR